MSTTRSGAHVIDYVSAPHDYSDLHRIYYGYVVSLVRHCGIEESRKEDVASDILLRFFERGFLEKFNPDLVFTYDGEQRQARFKSFLSKFVLAYLRGHWDRQRRLAYREPLICDSPMPGADGTCDATWVEIFGDTTPDHAGTVAEQLCYRDLLDRLRPHLATVPRRSRYDTCDLPALFDAVIAQIHEFGDVDLAALRQRFGVSSTAMHTWIWWLRANLADALGIPLPAKRPRTRRS